MTSATSSARAWLILAFGSQRQYAGNLGYNDDPTSFYLYDSFVPNAKRVTNGDLVVVRNHTSLIGVAEIGTIYSEQASKQQQRCPYCQNTGIKERVKKTPRFKCHSTECGAAFEDPALTTATCINYRAEYGESFVASGTPLNMGVLKAACPRYNGQHSIIEIDLDAIWSYVQATLSGTSTLDVGKLTSSVLVQSEPDEVMMPPDSKRRESRMMSVRSGQSAFRKQLVKAYGARCAVSSTMVQDALHAAHISPYMGDHSNTVENGLLLRADIHLLHDRFLLAFHPETLILHIHPQLADSEYAQFAGTMLSPTSSVFPDRKSLRAQWLGFIRATGDSLDSFLN